MIETGATYGYSGQEPIQNSRSVSRIDIVFCVFDVIGTVATLCIATTKQIVPLAITGSITGACLFSHAAYRVAEKVRLYRFHRWELSLSESTPIRTTEVPVYGGATPPIIGEVVDSPVDEALKIYTGELVECDRESF